MAAKMIPTKAASAMKINCFIGLFDEYIINVFFIYIGVSYLDFNLIPNPIFFSMPLADNHHLFFIQDIEIISQVFESDQALAFGFLFFDENSEISHSGDDSIIYFSDPIRHIFNLFIF